MSIIPSSSSQLTRYGSWSTHSDTIICILINIYSVDTFCFVKVLIDIQTAVEIIETHGGLTVIIEPPDAGENLLVEDGSIWTEKRPHSVWGQTLVPGLALGVHIRVEAVISPIAGERGHRS